jgi:hypothetical protein
MASNGWVARPERESIVGGGVRQLSARCSGRSAQAEARGSSELSGLARTVSLTGGPGASRESRKTDGDKAGAIPPGGFGEQSQGSSRL